MLPGHLATQVDDYTTKDNLEFNGEDVGNTTKLHWIENLRKTQLCRH